MEPSLSYCDNEPGARVVVRTAMLTVNITVRAQSRARERGPGRDQACTGVVAPSREAANMAAYESDFASAQVREEQVFFVKLLFHHVSRASFC